MFASFTARIMTARVHDSNKLLLVIVINKKLQIRTHVGKNQMFPEQYIVNYHRLFHNTNHQVHDKFHLLCYLKGFQNMIYLGNNVSNNHL